MPRIGMGVGVGVNHGGAKKADPEIVSVVALVYAQLGAIDPGPGTFVVKVPSGTAWSLTVDGEAAGSGTGTGGNQNVSVTATAAMVGTGVAVVLTAGGKTASTTTDVTQAYAIGDENPTLWCLPTTGITFGATCAAPVPTGWVTGSGATAASAGSDYTITATAGAGEHYLATPGVGTFNRGPFELVVEFVAGTASWVYLSEGASTYAWFDLSTGAKGTHTGTGYIDHAIVSLGGGRYRCTFQANAGSTPSLRIGVVNGDGVTTWTAAGETVTCRIIPAFELGGSTLYVQRCVASWTDARGNGNAWSQSDTARQPVYWRDAKGWCLVSRAYQWMQADAIAAAHTGENIPTWFAAAIDSVATAPSYKAVYNYGCTTHTRDHTLYEPYDTTNKALCARANDSGTAKNVPVITSELPTAAAVIDSFDGTTRALHYGSIAEVTANAAVSGTFTTDRLTLGAMRRNGGAIGLQDFRVREVAIHTTAGLASGNRDAAHSHLTTKYGY